MSSEAVYSEAHEQAAHEAPALREAVDISRERPPGLQVVLRRALKGRGDYLLPQSSYRPPKAMEETGGGA